jgi:hypothetical protein
MENPSGLFSCTMDGRDGMKTEQDIPTFSSRRHIHCVSGKPAVFGDRNLARISISAWKSPMKNN